MGKKRVSLKQEMELCESLFLSRLSEVRQTNIAHLVAMLAQESEFSELQFVQAVRRLLTDRCITLNTNTLTVALTLKHQREHPPRCLWCGSAFIPQLRTVRHCSRRCGQLHRRAQEKRNYEQEAA